MNKKISELLETIDLNDEDILMILQNGQNKKIKGKNALKNLAKQTDLEELAKKVEDKANQSDLDEITSNMTNQLLNIKSDITDLQTKEVLLFSGNATAGQTITLNDDYTKYRFLYIVNGTANTDWNGAMVGTTVNSDNEMYFTKGYLNANKSSQIHIANLRKISNTQLQVVECGYKVLTGNNGENSTTAFTSANVKKIYGSL